MPIRFVLAVCVFGLAGCVPGAFDDLRSSVRQDAGRTVNVDPDGGDSDVDVDAGIDSGSGGGAGSVAPTAGTSSAGRAGAGASDGPSGAGRGGAGASGSSGNNGGASASASGSSGASGASGAAGAGSGGMMAAGMGGALPPAAAGAAGEAPTSCPMGFADCNGDLAKGSSGNGCETAILGDVANCGGCANVCEDPENGYAACENAECIEYVSGLSAGRAVTATPHGSVGGQAYDQTCPAGEVLVGLDVPTDTEIAYGLNALCAPLLLGGSASAPKYTTGAMHAPNVLVGGIIDPVPPTERYLCPENTVIAGVAGVTFNWTDGTRVNPPSIRSISLACNELALSADHTLMFTPKKVIDIGDRSGQVQLYTDMCAASEVVVGFKGYAGAYIDALQTYCGEVSLSALSFTTTP